MANTIEKAVRYFNNDAELAKIYQKYSQYTDTQFRLKTMRIKLCLILKNLWLKLKQK